MLRILEVNGTPNSYKVAPEVEFQPGQIAQLVGDPVNSEICGVSNGCYPIGIIDDIRTLAFSTVVIDEVVFAHVPKEERILIAHASEEGELRGGQLVSTKDIKVALRNSNIQENSFKSYEVETELLPINGVVIFPAGTPLNCSYTGKTRDCIRAEVSYSHLIPNVPGDDSTLGTGRMCVWQADGMVFSTDQYDTNHYYSKGSEVYSNRSGLLNMNYYMYVTNYSVGTVVEPPSSHNPLLTIKWKQPSNKMISLLYKTEKLMNFSKQLKEKALKE